MKLILPLMALLSFPAFSMVTSGKKCPTEFDGVVKEIIPSVGPSHAYSTKRVIFSNSQDESEQFQLDLLENGPVTVETGEEYHVEMRNGRLCRIEQI